MRGKWSLWKASDGMGPEIDYLRISITDRCNLRCMYCMPEEGIQALGHDDIMSYEELELFARAAVSCGIRRIRLTGGEPLVRKGAVDFVRMLSGIDPDLRLSLTTHGVLLARYAEELKKAGLSRVNISLDSLDPETYRMLTRTGRLEEALEGLQRVIEVGLEPVKLNVVVLKGINDDPAPFAELARSGPVHVRFIEYMPYFGAKNGKWFISGDEIRSKLERSGELEEVDSPEGWGPADYYRLEGALGTVGFISPVTCHFCPGCNRLRISAEGRMRTCLFDHDGVDIRGAIRGGADLSRLREIIEGELERKRREGHKKPPVDAHSRITDHMSRIGG
ncbi:MAG: GTP 3',8-cyclase MoaA [Actinobacteria bacterium]|nr:GTP 3',8-cyclase MoaA [Actinomycetota bacterium]